MTRFGATSLAACAFAALSISSGFAQDGKPVWTSAGDVEVPELGLNMHVPVLPLPPERPAATVAPRVRVASVAAPAARPAPVVVTTAAAAPRRSTQIWLSMGTGF